MTTFALVSLGCPKNLVDSEMIAATLQKAGFSFIHQAESADVIIINTCSFIQKARDESIAVIDEMLRLKTSDKNPLIVAAGCLPALDLSISETDRQAAADLWIPSSETANLPALIREKLRINSKRSKQTRGAGIHKRKLYSMDAERARFTPFHYAYLKIAEGCSHSCTFCTIPLIKGRYTSRKESSILEEAKKLADEGVKEIILVAQDTTSFGDSPDSDISTLLSKLARIDSEIWIRLLYTHPLFISDKLIDTIAADPRICKYIDMPLQHTEDRILKLMGRRYTRSYIESLLLKLRDRIPGIGIRTTFIAGFPTETEEEHASLCGFVRQARFERAGIFPYSDEPASAAFRIPEKTDEKNIRLRYHRLAGIQDEIMREIHKSLFSKTISVIIDGSLENDKQYSHFGRSQWDTPDIDPVVYVSAAKKRRPLSQGDFAQVRITRQKGCDIGGKAIESAQ